MATDTRKKQAPPASGDKRQTNRAAMLLSPAIQAAAVQTQWSKFAGDLDITQVAAGLSEQIAEVGKGDLHRAEALLVSQAEALNTLFTSLAIKAAAQEYLGHLQAFMGLALKAQSQCRATLETLVTLKNPPVVYARQANVTSGPQQVINGAPPPPRARETANPPSELLEHTHGNRLDLGTAGATGRPDPRLATVEPLHRPQD